MLMFKIRVDLCETVLSLRQIPGIVTAMFDVRTTAIAT